MITTDRDLSPRDNDQERRKSSSQVSAHESNRQIMDQLAAKERELLELKYASQVGRRQEGRTDESTLFHQSSIRPEPETVNATLVVSSQPRRLKRGTSDLMTV